MKILSLVSLLTLFFITDLYGAHQHSIVHLNRSLLKALKHKDNPIAEVHELLESGAEADTLDPKTYRTPLHFAALYGYTFIADQLLTRKATVDLYDIWGNSPLHCAAANGFSETAKLLLQFRANRSQTNNKGYDPAHLALQQGYATLADSIMDWPHSIIMKKCETSHQAYLNLLLLQAVKFDNIEGVNSFLLEPNADINAPIFWNQQTALHLAVLNGQKNMICYLVSKGAEIRILDKFHRTPLSLAVQMKHFEICSILMYLDLNPDLEAFHDRMISQQSLPNIAPY